MERGAPLEDEAQSRGGALPIQSIEDVDVEEAQAVGGHDWVSLYLSVKILPKTRPPRNP